MTLRSVVLAVIVPFASTHHAGTAGKARPAIVQNGSNVVTYHFPNNIESAVAFSPDGSSFSIVREGLLKIAPNGAESFLPESVSPEQAITAASDIVYSDDSFGSPFTTASCARGRTARDTATTNSAAERTASTEPED